MDIGSLFLILALLILVGMLIARPLINRKADPMSLEIDRMDHELSSLLAERDRLLTAIQELDFDYALGKVPEGDYPVQRGILVQQGANVYRLLDQYEAAASEDDVEARLEAAIAARRNLSGTEGGVESEIQQPIYSAERVATGNGAKIPVAYDDEFEMLLAARRRNRQDKSAGFCPQCGRPVQKSDRFCPKCGKAID
jgi:hypothetical protein